MQPLERSADVHVTPLPTDEELAAIVAIVRWRGDREQPVREAKLTVSLWQHAARREALRQGDAGDWRRMPWALTARLGR